MATTAKTLIIKLHCGTEIRRFTSSNPLELSWASLSERVASYFDKSSETVAKHLKVTYVDDDNDTITISTDDELQEAIALALAAEPSVLRLTVLALTNKDTKPPATKGDTKPPAEDEKPTGASRATEAPRYPDLPPGLPAELAPFVESLAKQLPAAMAALPEGLKQLIPHAELDLAATVAANTPAGRQADSFCPAEPHAAAAADGVHEGVTCDKSGMSPIVGNRYHLVGHNYDLCEAEYTKLSDKEKALFRKVAPPGAAAAAAAAAGHPIKGVHPGVSCDRSGQCPIAGIRYNLKGHNYDLCQAEYDKLPDVEKQLYVAIPPPPHGMGGPCRPWGWRGGGRGCHGMMGNGGGMGGHYGGPHHGMGRGGEHPKLAARFVRDLTIFDGTQMAPSTPFTKIWRLKNIGEVPWPPGTRMLFVGGDQMTTEMSVPLSRETAVMPGEEVDVAIEMVAPTEHGRYLGYWRLTGPFMRRKFGQKVWCHVQVVDPSESGAEAFDDLPRTLAEIERKKSDLAAGEEVAGEEAADDEAAEAAADNEAADEAAADDDATMAAAAPTAALGAVDVSEAPPLPPPADEPTKDGTASDDGVLVSEPMPEPAAASSAADGVAAVRAALAAMGFVEPAMVDVVVAKHGGDVAACARDLAVATEWNPLLDDLEEMGFGNRELNKALMLKNDGNVKRTVRDLVEV